ncbi:hypothetical protein AALA61_15090 [Oscillospiraceae bacterium 42-9]
MTSKTEIAARLEFWRDALKALRKAYLALLDGEVKCYKLKDRELTMLDMPSLMKEIKEAEQKVDELEALASGGNRRKAVGVIPRDW